jgi:hypothetical protein
MTFRPVEFWQAALMTLPNNTFFDLMRSVLGTVKTPYNKQNLIDDLSKFLIRPEIQENIDAYIDANDRKLIAAIALLAEPLPGELESFFTGEFSYADLQGMLLNLEERLIIYRFRDKDNLRIALNPWLETVLSPYATNTDILFSAVSAAKAKAPSKQQQPPPPPQTPPEEQPKNALQDERTMAAFLSFIINSGVQVKEEIGGKDLSFVFRKKKAERGKQLFPGIDINIIAGGLLNLGLIVQKEDSVVPDEARIASFKELPDGDRMEYLAAGIAFFIYRNNVYAAWQSRNLLHNTVRLIHAIACLLAKDGNALPESTMIKLIELFRRQEEINWEFSGGVPPASILLNSLVMSGFFSTTTIEGTIFYQHTQKSADEASSKKQAPLIAMDSSFSCVLYPGISFADAIDMAAFSTVEETGTTVKFSLSRDSVVKSFDRMYTAESIYELLDRLSGGRIPETLQWNLNDWEKRWKEISLSQGVVLTLSAEREYLSGTHSLASMIAKKLAPGIYLLSASIEEAESALLAAGVDIVSRPSGHSAKSSSFFAPLGKAEAYALPKSAKKGQNAEKEEAKKDSEEIKNGFRATLEKMKLSKQEQEEMESRIQRRVIVSETQLKDTSLRYERLEARSLDYVGKTGIVRQAISTGSLLEVSCLNGDKILGTAESLEKKGTEMILTIRSRTGGEPQKINLGKISLIRRIKQSIFGA